MHKEVLTEKQRELLPLLSRFAHRFGLVGGTAIALHLGHRESVDFDLFTLKNKPFKNSDLKKIVLESKNIDRVIIDKLGEFTFIVDSVKLTFYHYEYEQVRFSERLDNIITMPNLLTLAAMKAYALGRRAKWKDYVDLYFVMKDFYSLEEITKKATELFGKHFNAKMFRVQLAYFDDIDYSEKISYKRGFETDEETIKRALTDFSLS